MIFNFTREEKEILYEIEKRNLEERAQAAGSDKADQQISIRIRGEQEFQLALRKLEKARFSKLKGNPGLILADAQDTAEAGLYYAADYFANIIYLASEEHWQALKKKKPDLKPEEAEADNYLIYLRITPQGGTLGLDIRQNLQEWDWDTFRGRSEQIPDKVNFSKDNAREWIKEVAIPEHVRTLKGKKEGETLDNFVDDLLERLPFVVYVESPAPAGSAETVSKDPEPAGLPIVSGKISDNVFYPIDRANGIVWNLSQEILEEKKSGQLAFTFPIMTIAETKSTPGAGITYSIDFSALEEVEISKKLNPFDKAVYIACATLYKTGNKVISVQQIHSQMGSDRRANEKDYKRIYESLTKMSKAWISIENKSEVDNYKKESFTYEGPLLAGEYVTARAGGNVTKSAVHLLREPALISYAESKKQITTVKTEYLKTRLRSTDSNLLLKDYMIRNIVRMKDGKQNKKLTFQTILENVSEDPGKKNELDRLKDKVITLLDDFTASGFIKGAKLTKDKKAVEIIL